MTPPDPETIATEELAREIAEVCEGNLSQAQGGGAPYRVRIPEGVFLVSHLGVTLECFITHEQARALARAVRAVLDGRDPVEDVRTLAGPLTARTQSAQIAAERRYDEDFDAIAAYYAEEGAP